MNSYIIPKDIITTATSTHRNSDLEYTQATEIVAISAPNLLTPVLRATTAA